MTYLELFVAMRFGVGVIAIVLMAYVTYGFRHVVSHRTIFRTLWNIRDANASEILRVALTIFHIKSVIRLAVWDVVMVLLFWWSVVQGGGAIYVAVINTALALMAIAASLLTMASQHKLIPKDERDSYSMWSAPLYPWSKLQRRAALDNVTNPTERTKTGVRNEEANIYVACIDLAQAVQDGVPYQKLTDMASRILDR